MARCANDRIASFERSLGLGDYDRRQSPAEISEWDDALLATQLRELAALALDFSPEVTGFDMGEIDLRTEQSSLTNDDERANQIRELSGDSPISRSGDPWILRFLAFAADLIQHEQHIVL